MTAIMAIPGAYDTAVGISSGSLVELIHGVTSCILAAYLAYCAVLCHRGEGARINTPPMIKAAYLTLGPFAAGFLYKIITVYYGIAA